MKALQLVEHPNHTAELIIRRPEALNALNKTVLDELDQVLTQLESSSLRALLIIGEGKAFVAGADINEMKDLSKAEAYELSLSGQKLFRRLGLLPMVTVAGINGFALGGGLELALSCDFILMSDKAKVGLPEVGLGLIPGYGGTQRLAKAVGMGWAKRLTLTGEMISAETAIRIGLATEVCPAERLKAQCLEVLNILASKAPLAQELAKKSIDEGYSLLMKDALDLEAEYFAQTFATEDHNEGIEAFLNKRAPRFLRK